MFLLVQFFLGFVLISAETIFVCFSKTLISILAIICSVLMLILYRNFITETLSFIKKKLSHSKCIERAEGMEVSVDIFIRLLRSELTQTELDTSVKAQLTPEVISALYSLSQKHDLAHIVSAALYRNNLLPPGEMQVKFDQEAASALLRYERMQDAYHQICAALDESAVPYIPLKGAVLRPYYPQESMRTSCDIDILVKQADLDRAVAALTAKNFRLGAPNYHDISLYSPQNVHLELHFTIQEKTDSLDAVLKDAWHYAVPEQWSRCQFTKAFFLFYMYAHMNYHFRCGGCGVRSLMDIWVMEHQMGLSYTQAGELLQRAGIYQFAAELTNLAEACFSYQPRDTFADMLLQYILKGNRYGTKENKMAITRAESHTTLGYAMKRLFMPYNLMAEQFPILEKAPVLLPACWGVRFVRLLLDGKTGRIVTELKSVNDIPDCDNAAMREIRRRLEL